MSRVRPKLARPAEGQEEVHRRGGKVSTETDRAAAPVLDPEYEDSSVGDRNELKFLKERQDLELEEVMQTLTCHIRKLWEAKVTTPEVRPSKSSSRKERWAVKDPASTKPQLVGKMEDSKIEDTESLTSERKPAELRRKSDEAKARDADQGTKSPAKVGVRKGLAAAPRSQEGQRNRKVLGEVLDRVREVGARRSLEHLKDAEKPGTEGRLRGAAGASLTLAADLSWAALEVGPQWGRVFSILKENGFDPKFLCRLELAFRCDGETQTFSDLRSLRKFSSQKAFLKDVLEEVFEQNANSCRGGSPHGRQKKRDSPPTTLECGAGDPAGDGLNFLFVKEAPSGSRGNLDALSGVTKFAGKERNRTLQVEELTPEEAALIQETEENFRRRVVSILRELREEVDNMGHRQAVTAATAGRCSLDSLRSRVGQLESRVSQLDDQVEEVARAAVQMSRQLVNNDKLRVREDRFRSTNMRVIGVPEKDTRENGAEDIVGEIMEENFPDLSIAVVSAQRVPDRVDERKLTPRHILVTFWSPGERERVLKASRDREVTYRGRSVRLTADFSLSTLDARSQWRDIIKVLQDSGFHPRIRYPAKLTIDLEGKTRTFFDVNEFRRFVSRLPSLKELLENVL
ncbi:LINE-1 type transposase domain-containing protein 1 isoform X2 [Cavia porcellus]|uniref:LINE-1 type transposase domain-containing protein 1 isoform X2 n=1 Tax=Cavia porcellus TaxID=10141 RepID=UPI002FDF12A3